MVKTDRNKKHANLEFDSNRYRVKQCPCGKNNADGKFVPYIGYEDKGYCHSCSAVFLPGFGKLVTEENAPPLNPTSFVPLEILKKSLGQYDQNTLIQFLHKLCGTETTNNLVKRYQIGSAKFWTGSSVFWQEDFDGNIRGGKIIQYATQPSAQSAIGLDCKRVKENFPPVKWVHRLMGEQHFVLEQCFFGEHLLKIYKTEPVAIVESEKTAIIASAYLPQFIWLAAGSVGGLAINKCEVLKGRAVCLFPDLKCYEKWNNKAKELSAAMPNTSFLVSDLLETKATEEERMQGLDLADYLIRHNWKTFNNSKSILS